MAKASILDRMCLIQYKPLSENSLNIGIGPVFFTHKSTHKSKKINTRSVEKYSKDIESLHLPKNTSAHSSQAVSVNLHVCEKLVYAMEATGMLCTQALALGSLKDIEVHHWVLDLILSFH